MELAEYARNGVTSGYAVMSLSVPLSMAELELY